MNFANPLHQTIYEKVVKPALNARPDKVKGLVLEFYEEDKRCLVRFADPNTGSPIELVAPIQITGGINNPGPFAGEEVLIEFPGGNYTFPVITGVIDLYFRASTRARRQQLDRKGSFMPDGIGERMGRL